ncbi:2,3-diketo-5-methylthio-1-phosphopentane phosphatase [Fonticula alba]|uniref:2,3-diketo-5-methylthio-1-phosphopentane phosphatase n=1 Tax=Fonticula alba TaxID=691883 RepID=A0A058Z6F1_FONAL|nr:2,3-diketo-5-methylthio-1-phosphopentane phosphatase [Fonticula alba]KCV69468.1 2,3-diketo-5-methylthio-1-phosphopentane phosphatase [Fonticula alba]|eukprot:XP_009496033.1 2,3-diketo-5-methylthio-1-phosphopentane phosphatase [Fonticula alba]
MTTLSFPGVSCMLLDIEGTTTSISFVHDVLFPYAAANLEAFLRSHPTDPNVIRHTNLLVEECAAESAYPHAPLGPSPSVEELMQYIRFLMAADRKSPGLKGLQGQCWDAAYRSGLVKGHLFADVLPAFRRWSTSLPKGVAIYSSGSVPAQRLLFGFSEEGDLTPYLVDYFDTGVGAKIHASSYATITQRLDVSPGAILFASDNPLELLAAHEAGLQAVLLDRPGNAPISSEMAARLEALHIGTVQSFAQIELP